MLPVSKSYFDVKVLTLFFILYFLLCPNMSTFIKTRFGFTGSFYSIYLTTLVSLIVPVSLLSIFKCVFYLSVDLPVALCGVFDFHFCSY